MSASKAARLSALIWTDPFGALDDGHRPALLDLLSRRLPRDADEPAAARLGDVGHPAFHLAALEPAHPDVAVEVVEKVVGDGAPEPVLLAHRRSLLIRRRR
jgi:hypothetical protein